MRDSSSDKFLPTNFYSSITLLALLIELAKQTLEDIVAIEGGIEIHRQLDCLKFTKIQIQAVYKSRLHNLFFYIA